jgi:chromosome partitioning protein
LKVFEAKRDFAAGSERPRLPPTLFAHIETYGNRARHSEFSTTIDSAEKFMIDAILALVHTCNTEILHMRTVAISINKGGQGKTTTVKTLATAAVAAGHNVLILDVDTQQNSVGWRKRRDKLHQDRPLPLARFCGEKDLLEQIKQADKAGCDLLLIDTPPGKSSEAMAAVEASELVIIPFWNDQDSYEGVAMTAVMTRRLGKKAVGLLNFATPNSKSHEDAAREVLKVVGLPMAPVVLHRYDLHRLANIRGLTAQEMEPSSVAALESESLWQWFCAHVQMGNGANVPASTSAILQFPEKESHDESE